MDLGKNECAASMYGQKWAKQWMMNPFFDRLKQFVKIVDNHI
jgi:hypothetical protein